MRHCTADVPISDPHSSVDGLGLVLGGALGSRLSGREFREGLQNLLGLHFLVLVNLQQLHGVVLQ